MAEKRFNLEFTFNTPKPNVRQFGVYFTPAAEWSSDKTDCINSVTLTTIVLPDENREVFAQRDFDPVK